MNMTLTNMFELTACQKDLLTYEPLDGTSCAVTGLNVTSPAAQPVRLVIPGQAPDGRTVTAIADRAFTRCGSLRTVSLPDSVTYIGVRAFAFCSSLLEIRLGRNSRLQKIGDRAFMCCERLSVLRHI